MFHFLQYVTRRKERNCALNSAENGTCTFAPCGGDVKVSHRKSAKHAVGVQTSAHNDKHMVQMSYLTEKMMYKAIYLGSKHVFVQKH